MLSRYFLDYSVGVGAFVIGLSQISSFFSCHGKGTFSLHLHSLRYFVHSWRYFV